MLIISRNDIDERGGIIYGDKARPKMSTDHTTPTTVCAGDLVDDDAAAGFPPVGIRGIDGGKYDTIMLKLIVSPVA